jgi:hypothetical protein
MGGNITQKLDKKTDFRKILNTIQTTRIKKPSTTLKRDFWTNYVGSDQQMAWLLDDYDNEIKK